jgi:hypothetical protein
LKPAAQVPLIQEKSKEDNQAKAKEAERLREEENRRHEEERQCKENEAMKQEALRKQQELEDAMRREAEAKRLKALEQELIRKEQEEAIAQQKLEEERQVRLAALARQEEERDHQLELLLQQYLFRKYQRLQAQAFDALFNFAVESATKDYRRELQLVWNRWNIALAQSIKLRERFAEDLRSVDIAPAETFTSHRTKNLSAKKRKHPIEDDDNAHDRRKRERESLGIVHLEQSVMSLTDVLKLRMAELISKDQNHGFDDYLPLDLPAIFGPSLFRLQSQRVRQYRGVVPDEYSSDSIAVKSLGSKATWNNDLFLKVAVLSQSMHAGKWNVKDDEGSNLIRLLMCTHDEDSPSHLIGRWNESINCSIDSRQVNRTVRISVVDLCQDYSKLTDASVLCGSQIVVLVLSSHSQNDWKSLPFMSDLSRSTKSMHLVIIFTSISRSSKSSSFRDLGDDYRNGKCSQSSHELLNSLANCISIAADELLDKVAGLYELSYPSVSYCSIASKCRACLSNAFQNILISYNYSALSFPLIQRFEAVDWIRDALSSAIWQPQAHPTGSSSNDGTLLAITASVVSKVSDCITSCEQLLSNSEYCQTGFPAIDFAADQSCGSVSGVVFENLSGSNSIKISCDWSHHEVFQSSVTKVMKHLMTLKNIFSLSNEDELWEFIRDRYADQYKYKHMRNNRRSMQRFVDKVIDRFLSKCSNEEIILSIPSNITEATNPILAVSRDSRDSLYLYGEESSDLMDENQLVSDPNIVDDEPDIGANNIVALYQVPVNEEAAVKIPRKFAHLDQLERFVANEIDAGQALIDSLKHSLHEDESFEQVRPSNDVSQSCTNIDSMLLYLEDSKRERVASNQRFRNILL